MPKKDIPMDEDIQKYPVYILYNREIIPAPWIKDTTCYDHSIWQLHHFIRKTMRKNSLDFYKRVEHLQKLILIPKQMNYDLENMGEETFSKEHHGLNKNDLVFSRLKWREGYYDTRDE